MRVIVQVNSAKVQTYFEIARIIVDHEPEGDSTQPWHRDKIVSYQFIVERMRAHEDDGEDDIE